jgi:hypothetical protein
MYRLRAFAAVTLTIGAMSVSHLEIMRLGLLPAATSYHESCNSNPRHDDSIITALIYEMYLD